MTKAEKRAVLLAIAGWTPRGTSVELLVEDQREIRDDVTFAIASALGLDAETAMTQMQALRMTS